MVSDAKYRLSSDFTEDVLIDGAWLRQVGLPLTPGKAEDVLIWNVRKI
jgi:hypothetical protein